jgi:hypothetical protein
VQGCHEAVLGNGLEGRCGMALDGEIVGYALDGYGTGERWEVGNRGE